MPKDNIGLAALIKTKEAAWENGMYTLSLNVVLTKNETYYVYQVFRLYVCRQDNIRSTNIPYWNIRLSSGIPTDSSMLGQPILVCTAHIYWDPEFCDVKLIQTIMLSNELRTILDDSARTLRLAGQRENVQLLLCGDFNSLPDSGKYVLVFGVFWGYVAKVENVGRLFPHQKCLRVVDFSLCKNPAAS